MAKTITLTVTIQQQDLEGVMRTANLKVTDKKSFAALVESAPFKARLADDLIISWFATCEGCDGNSEDATRELFTDDYGNLPDCIADKDYGDDYSEGYGENEEYDEEE